MQKAANVEAIRDYLARYRRDMLASFDKLVKLEATQDGARQLLATMLVGFEAGRVFQNRYELRLHDPSVYLEPLPEPDQPSHHNQSVWWQGAASQRTGKTQNPYPHYSREWFAWQQGWNDSAGTALEMATNPEQADSQE